MHLSRLLLFLLRLPVLLCLLRLLHLLLCLLRLLHLLLLRLLPCLGIPRLLRPPPAAPLCHQQA